jgi:uncharacterized protein (TIGR02145 family)
MKSFFWILFVGFAMTKLTAQSYIDINFAGENNVIPQTIQVSNLTKGVGVTLSGNDILRLTASPSGLQSVNSGKSELAVYPNPMEQDGFFSFVNPVQGQVDIQLHSLSGKLIYQNSYELSQGDHHFAITGVPEGIQLLTVTTHSGNFAGRISSTGGNALKVEATPSEQKTIEEQHAMPVLSRINSQREGIVELHYTPGDELHFKASSPGYVSQGIYASPTENQTFTILLTQVVEVVNPATGKIWMDRNLGASQAATSSADEQAYGDLYQWGRGSDGHEKRNSPTTSVLSSSDSPGHGMYINTSSYPYDWRSVQNNNLWQGVDIVNNPCPTGFRLPTFVEWFDEIFSWRSNNSAGAFASPLKLSVTGYRDNSLFDVGSIGYYWSGVVHSTYAYHLYFHNGYATMHSSGRAAGFSVRCIKD